MQISYNCSSINLSWTIKNVVAFCVVKCVRLNDLKWKKGEAFDVQIKVLKSVMQSRDDCKMSKNHSLSVAFSRLSANIHLTNWQSFIMRIFFV